MGFGPRIYSSKFFSSHVCVLPELLAKTFALAGSATPLKPVSRPNWD